MGSAALGAAAVIGAVLAFGSFGVPIKSRRLQDAQVHPLVVQCYKTAACFATCWLALLIVPLRFTWWGTAGAAIWVFNGIAAIVAIQAAGLAVAQALWSGLSVFVAFVWGVAVFREPVASLPLAIAGLCLMAVGMAAVGIISGHAAATVQRQGGSGVHTMQPGEPADAADAETQRLVDGGGGSSHDSEGAPCSTRHPPLPEAPGPPDDREAALPVSTLPAGLDTVAVDAVPTPALADDPPHTHYDGVGLTAQPAGAAAAATAAAARQPFAVSYGAGIACAVYVGIANGSFLVPLKYANRSVTGLEYLVSFGIGAALVTAAAAAAHSAAARRFDWRQLDPAVRAAGPPALLAGLLWSAGNVFSILATQELGLALAWPAVQAQLLVSTAWGALHYGEVHGVGAFGGLLAGSAAVVGGVALLAAAKG